MSMKKKHYIFQLNMTVLNILASIIFVVGMIAVISIFNFTSYRIDFDYERDYALLMFLLVPYFMLHEVFHFFG